MEENKQENREGNGNRKEIKRKKTLGIFAEEID